MDQRAISLLYFEAQRLFAEAAQGNHDGICDGLGCWKCFLAGVEPLLEALRDGPPPTGRSLLGIAPDLTGGVESTEYVRRLRGEPSQEAIKAFQAECKACDGDSPSDEATRYGLIAALQAIDGRGTATP